MINSNGIQKNKKGKIMKKILSILLLSINFFMIETYYSSSTSRSSRSSYNSGYGSSSNYRSNSYRSNNNRNDSGHYIFNLTGRNVRFNFYTKRLDTMFVGYEIVHPLLLGGNSPDGALPLITANLLPKKIDMHTLSSSYVKAKVLDLGGINNKIKSCKFPTPSLGNLFPHDYKITLEDDQLVVTLLNTSRGIPIAGKRQTKLQQWPSVEDIAIMKMPPQEKIVAYQQQNVELQKDIDKLDKEIKSMRDKNGVIKAGMLTKINNRKAMRATKDSKIKANNRKIAHIQKQLSNPTSVNTSDDGDDDDNSDGTDIEDINDIDDSSENPESSEIPATPAKASTKKSKKETPKKTPASDTQTA